MHMRFLSTLLVTAAIATAQSPLTTTFINNNGGSAGGGVYFLLSCQNAAGATVTQIDLNLSSAAGTAGTIDLYTYNTLGTTVPHSPITNWTPVSLGNAAVSAGPGQPSVVTLTLPLIIDGNCSVGIGIQANGLSHAYTNGTNAYPVPGNLFSNADMTINAGQASNIAFAGSAFSPRMVNCNVHYTIGGGGPPCPPVATVTPQGLGCDPKSGSFYEEMTKPNFDLSGGWLTMTRNGASHNVEFIPNCPLFPIGQLGVAAPVVLTDDSQAAVGTLGLTVGSNGWVALGAGNSNAFTPVVATLLANPSRAWYSWKDLNPTIVGSGQVWYEEDVVNGQARITFDGVWTFGGTSIADACFIQFTYNSNTGDMTLSWGTIGLLGTNWLVGYSPGGAGLDPGPTDLSSLVAPNVLVRPYDEQLALGLVAIGRPVQGPASVNFDVTTTNIPASALIHIGIVGLSRPGIPLIALGAPNCFLNASPDILVGPDFSPPSSFTWTALNLPAAPPTFYGFEFNVQGAILGTPKNPALGLGVLTSNGLKCVVGGV